jgi:hypothetical protein
VKPHAFALLAVAVVVAGCGTSRAASDPPPLRTLPGLQPPRLTVTHAASATAPGYVFLAVKKPGLTGGPLIVDNRGRIVWYRELAPPLQATDFRVQRYRGRPVLTWWQGTIDVAGIGHGTDVVYDTSYRRVAQVHAVGGVQTDLHEFQLTPRGTAYVTGYRELPVDLSSVGGPKHGWVLDSVVQEIDVATGRPVFRWSALEHVPLEESVQAHQEPARHAAQPRPFDFFHVNSVSDGPGGSILVSGRNVSAVYDVARDGHIAWRLGGKRSDFATPAGGTFWFQHDVRLHPGNVVSLFDNGGIPKLEPFTRPLVLKLDLVRRRARVVRTFVHPGRIAAPFEGNLQLLPGGGAFVGWGGVPKVTEFGPDGRVRFELGIAVGDTYRGYRLAWAGRPSSPPAVVAAAGTVYASWNGATGVARWVVLGGRDASHLTRIAAAPWRGLETAIAVGELPRTVVVRALDADGRVLGSSPPAGG